LALALAGQLGVPRVELDGVFHQAGWTPLDAGEFRARVAAAIASDSWVIDGNYSAIRDLVWARADTVVWLDLPRYLVMRRLIARTLRRVATREELWNGNREHWRNFFSLDPGESVIVYAWGKHADNHRRYLAASRDPANGHLAFVRLTSPRAVRRFLTSLA
jgi:adenylate kinase family enzyme